jgi:hypothetical protein
MTQLSNFDFPDDLGLALAIGRRALQFIRDEQARSGLTEEQVAEKYGVTFEENERQMEAFLEKLKG